MNSTSIPTSHADVIATHLVEGGQAIVDQTTIVVGYDTDPHVEIDERAQEVVGLLVRAIRGET
ncbi:MAG: M81 family metallopeptidase [Chloroflexota bacterium]|nr:M81 family metallopeptidase [Chloroflexota bacterium]